MKEFTGLYQVSETLTFDFKISTVCNFKISTVCRFPLSFLSALVHETSKFLLFVDYLRQTKDDCP